MNKINQYDIKAHEIDPCTLSNYSKFEVLKTYLELDVSFEEKKISGNVTYHLKVIEDTNVIRFDTSYLDVNSVSVNDEESEFTLGERIEPFGSPLQVLLQSKRDDLLTVTVYFKTTEKCTAIQFIKGDTGPYIFSQCQAIHARSLFPCFDTPAVKSVYEFKARSSSQCLMSGIAQSCDEKNTYKFVQNVPIPSYLVSITSGNIHSAPIGPRSDVLSELPNLKACQWEFEKDTENFIQIAEKLIFEYEWSSFNALVLPASFPYGGMEIPNYTQVTPTLICEDRSQVRVLAHELAHSWSGNLVTNKSWEHFWLNEGWTVYLERRILGKIAEAEARASGISNQQEYGEKYRNFCSILGWNSLKDAVETMDAKFTSLVIDLENINPDDSFSRIPYEKGFNFIFYLEKKLGGLKDFDPFITYYFKKYRYKSLDSFQFIDTLYEFFIPLGKKETLDSINWNEWLYSQGLPTVIPEFDTSLADECYRLADSILECFTTGEYDRLPDVKNLSSNQDILLIETLQEKLKSSKPSPDLIQSLSEKFPKYTESSNGEIITAWCGLLLSLRKCSEDDRIVIKYADWLGIVGRMKYVRPGYRVLSRAVSKDFAIKTYKKHELVYHPICRDLVKKDLGLN